MATKKKAVIKAAKELNDKLGLDPQIDVNAGPDELMKQVAEAGELIESDDNISDVTQETVTELLDHGWQKEAEEEEEEEPKPKPKEKSKPKESAEPTERRVTKKSVVEEALKEGATIEQMAEKVAEAGIDDDYDKNYRVVKAHLRKMGYDVKKSSIEADPIFTESA